MGKRIATLDFATKAIFSPDGQLVATIAATTDSVHLWNLDGQLIGSINDAGAYNLTFSPDSRRLLLTDREGIVRQYILDIDDLLAMAPCRIARGLTQSEIDVFQVPTPLQLDFSKRQCPPELSWIANADSMSSTKPSIFVQPSVTGVGAIPTTTPLESTPVSSVPSQSTPEPAAETFPIRLDDNRWAGGYGGMDDPKTYAGRTATWIYGSSTAYDTMKTTFNMPVQPEGAATLTIMGMDSEDRAKTSIDIYVNGSPIYTGPNPLPDDDLPLETGVWSTYSWTFDADLLRVGTNTITITNLDTGAISEPPWFMLDYAEITLHAVAAILLI